MVYVDDHYSIVQKIHFIIFDINCDVYSFNDR